MNRRAFLRMLPMAPVAAPFAIKAAFDAGAPQMRLGFATTTISASYKAFDWSSLSLSLGRFDKRTQLQKDAAVFEHGFGDLDRSINQFSSLDRIVEKVIDKGAECLLSVADDMAPAQTEARGSSSDDIGDAA